jgi:Fe-S cluster assembly protein SufD
LDEEGLFYLRSRGVSEKTAKSLLVHAFAIDILEHIKPEPIRSYVDQLISERLEFVHELHGMMHTNYANENRELHE